MKGLMVRCVIAASVCGALAFAATAAPTKRATVTVSGYAGTTELTNFPVLVRISEDRICGFSYADCKDDGGSDLSFVDMDGAVLAHEIDTWDEDGESLVWVNVPVVTNNASFVMRWCDDDPPTSAAYDTWNSDYVGVWHMGEAVGVCANSTSHGSKYDATPAGVTNDSGLYGNAAPVGGARTTATASSRGYLSVPSYDDEGVGGVFTVSCWLRVSAISGNPRVFMRKPDIKTGDGFQLTLETANQVWVCGGGGTQVFGNQFPSPVTNWVHLAVAFDGTSCRIYGNGALLGSGTVVAVVDNGLPLAFGANANKTDNHYVNGAFDECRLKKGAASADWVKAEYDTVKGDAFVTFGNAEPIDSDASSPVFFGISVVERGDSYATLSATVWSLGEGASSATLSCAYGKSAASLNNTVASTATDSTGQQTLSLTRLMPGTTYYAQLTLTNDQGESVTGEVFEITTLPADDAPSGIVGLNQTFFTSAKSDWTKDYTTLPAGADWMKYTDNDRVYRRERGTIMAYVRGNPKEAKYTSEIWSDEVYWPENGGQWVYWGYMFMEKGKSYKFRSFIDDYAYVKVTRPSGVGSDILINSTTLASVMSVDYIPSSTGWHIVEVRVGDNAGYAGAGSNIGMDSVNMGYSADGGETWSMLLDPGDGSLLRTTAPSDDAPSIAVEETTSQGKQALRLTFAAAEAARSLVAAWGPRRGYGTTNDWANCAFAGEITAGETGFTYELPDDWGTDDNLVVRFCLAEDGKLPLWSATTYWHKTASRGMQIILR